MPQSGAPVAGEKDPLLEALGRQRADIVMTLHALSEAQLRQVLTPSGNSLLGLLQHLAESETVWICEPFGNEVAVRVPDDHSEVDLRVGPHASVDGVFADYRRARECADRVIRNVEMDARGVTRAGQVITLHAAMVHLFEDVTRHAGHVDVMRALLDGHEPAESAVNGPTVVYAPMPHVIFVCTSNAGRSQMAEALMNLKAGTRCRVSSAGTQPARRVSPLAAGVIREIGGEMSRSRTKPLDDEALLSADAVVILGSDVDLEPPAGMRAAVHRWIIDEPSARGIMGADRMRLVRDDIEAHVNALIDSLGLAE